MFSNPGPHCSRIADKLEKIAVSFLCPWCGLHGEHDYSRWMQIAPHIHSFLCRLVCSDCLLCIHCQPWALITWPVHHFPSPEIQYALTCLSFGWAVLSAAVVPAWNRSSLQECCCCGSFHPTVGLISVVLGQWCEAMS